MIDVVTGPSDPPPPLAGEEIAQLQALAHDIEALDPRRHFNLNDADLEQLLVGPLTRLGEDVLGAIDAFEATLDNPDGPVGSLCFMARMEIKSTVQPLHQPKADRRERLIACDVARERLKRSVEALVSTAAGPGPDGSEDLEGRAAAAVRSMYAQFRKALTSARLTDESGTTNALGVVALALLAMSRRPAFQAVRLSDRFIIEELWRKILEWGTPDATHEDGQSLLLDAHAVGGLLAAINRRPELVAFDRRNVSPLHAQVKAATEGGPLDDAGFSSRAELLLGRDEALDQAIEAWRRVPTSALALAHLERALARVAEDLEPEEASSIDPFS